MKRFIYPAIIIALIAIFIILTPRNPQKISSYQNSESNLLIPQKNSVIVTLNLSKNNLDITKNETLRKLIKLNALFSEINGVNRVDSLLNATVITSSKTDIVIGSFIPEKLTDLQLTELMSTSQNYPELLPYINNNHSSMIFYISFGKNVSSNKLFKSLNEINNKSDIKFYFTGKAPIMSLTEELLSKDILIFMPILFIIIMAIFRIFKSTKIIIISWVIMLLAVALAYSLVSFLGIKLTPLVLLVPIFALGLLSDYIIHYIYHFLFSPITGNNLNTRRSLIFPLGLTALSTLTGFFSLIYIGLSGHVLLGSIIGIAVIITFIGVFLWLPYLSFPKISIEILPKFSYYQVKFFDFLYRSRKPLFLLLTITVIWGITTLPNLRIEPYPIEQLPQDSTVKMAENILNSDFYGALPFFIEIDSGEVNGFLRKKTLLAVDKITSHLNESKEIGFNYSLLSVLKQINSYFNGNENSIFDYKDEFGFYQMLIEQYLIYYSSSVDPLEYESLVDPSFRYFSIKGYVKYTSVDSLNSFYDTIEEIKKELPQDWSLSVHGVIDELKKDKKSLQKNWIFSFGIGNFLIFITVLIFYRKFRLALFSLIPGFISMIISFGIISLLGIKIDSFSIIFVAIITGLVIDYSIHTLSAIDKIHEVASIKEGFTYINNYSGIPIFLSFLTSLFSFSVLFLSSFSGARSLGILLSISLLVSYILSFYLLPIIILPTKIKKEH